ncbi:MAG: LysM peptidoglycan-binding domain-containing protein, partial [Acidobacteria bacterium]|nr:LysM peptidoglycan-binding domain-containing protein [Acidobacteriota bacterium]
GVGPGSWRAIAPGRRSDPRLRAGETLWRIARTYGVPLDDLARENGIADPTRIEIGTADLRQGSRTVLEVPPLGAGSPRARARAETRLSRCSKARGSGRSRGRFHRASASRAARLVTPGSTSRPRREPGFAPPATASSFSREPGARTGGSSSSITGRATRRGMPTIARTTYPRASACARAT